MAGAIPAGYPKPNALGLRNGWAQPSHQGQAAENERGAPPVNTKKEKKIMMGKSLGGRLQTPHGMGAAIDERAQRRHAHNREMVLFLSECG